MNALKSSNKKTNKFHLKLKTFYLLIYIIDLKLKLNKTD